MDFGTIVNAVKVTWNNKGKLLNYYKRPKLLIELSSGVFDFALGEETRRIDMAYISIKNNEKFDVTIVSNSIFLDNNRFPTGGDELLKWLHQNGARPILPETHENMYWHYNDPNNHLNISSGMSTFIIKPSHTKIFPIMLIGSAITNLFSIKSKSNLITQNRLMSVTLNVNEEIREYGIDREMAYKNYLNFLAAYTAKFPPFIKETLAPHVPKKLKSGLPFSVNIPNKQTAKTLQDSKAGLDIIEAQNMNGLLQKLRLNDES